MIYCFSKYKLKKKNIYIVILWKVLNFKNIYTWKESQTFVVFTNPALSF